MNDLSIRIILGILSLTFFAVWKFTTPYTLKDYIKNFFKFRSLVFAVTQILMVFQLFYAQGPALSSNLARFTGVIAGIILAIIGTALAIWAKFTMKKNWGLPAQHEIKKQQKLVTTGPFAFTRNPIYIGLLLLFFGFELALGSYAALLVFPFAYLFYRAVLVEEKLLTKHFGKEYTSYTSRIHRFL